MLIEIFVDVFYYNDYQLSSKDISGTDLTTDSHVQRSMLSVLPELILENTVIIAWFKMKVAGTLMNQFNDRNVCVCVI